ncbi:IKS protein kinase, variant [Puccinia sorghi]|uniref:IKS protein kinase, variant n=1 Tax=Puccinia sorghi TaxID=27349 RepID=A0A0L6V7J8_9BASI|nr:IKS protein kinase, variant [Puccinia sorghi]
MSSSWQVVLRQSTGKLVLYHSNENRLTVHSTTNNALRLPTKQQHCPLCLQPLNILPDSTSTQQDQNQYHSPSGNHTVTQDSYFNLLSLTNSPPSISPIQVPPSVDHSFLEEVEEQESHNHEDEPLGHDKRVDGYYHRFFIEVRRLGRGQKGSVFLCTHTLDGNPLGDYAIKKIAVGQSSHQLSKKLQKILIPCLLLCIISTTAQRMQVLNEVKFLESLRHPNITQYHHAWIEKTQLSRFGPKVPVLYILMNFANGGTLDDYISLRKGSKSTSTAREHQLLKPSPKSRAGFFAALSSPWTRPSSSDPTDRAVHLFRFDEIFHIFQDTCKGLGFLHSQGILHHDLKTENVLLHWTSDDAMMLVFLLLAPTAMISDFGSSISQSENWSRERSDWSFLFLAGRTGTLDWVPPESLQTDPKTGKLHEVTQKGDLWQLGLVLHCLCFFRLPYTHSEDIDLLKDEITKYPGYYYKQERMKEKMRSAGGSAHQSSRLDLPRSLLKLLSDLLCLDARLRPSCERVLSSLEAILEEAIPHESTTQPKTAPTASNFVGSDGVSAVPFGPAHTGSTTLVKRRRIVLPECSDETFTAHHQFSANHNNKQLSILPASSFYHQSPHSSSSASARFSPPSSSSRYHLVLSRAVLKRWIPSRLSLRYPLAPTLHLPLLFALFVSLKQPEEQVSLSSSRAQIQLTLLVLFNTMELVTWPCGSRDGLGGLGKVASICTHEKL